MAIRIRTLEELSRRNRSIARVRWRVWEEVAGKVVVDSDGSDRAPGTWARWEEEYYLQVRSAVLGLKADPHGHLRPRGVIDQVLARELWGAMRRQYGLDSEELEPYEEGRLRVLYSMVSGPGRLPSDGGVS